MTEQLRIILGERPVALLEADAGRFTLRYDADVVREAAGSHLLSLRLPVREEPYGDPAVRAFVDGLLPEQTIRQQLCRKFRIAFDDSAGLLRRIGGDCAGAVSFVPPSDVDAWLADPADAVVWLDDDELWRRVDVLEANPLAEDPEHGIRISLAGAQNKLVVVVGDHGRIGLPKGRAPSTHILKPPSAATTLKGNPVFPSMVENELFCQRLARNTGFPAAAVSLRRLNDVPLLLVERYDRAVTAGGRRVRLHQEDLCQALGVDPLHKYQDDGGPSVAAVVDVLRRHSTEPGDALAFLERVAFNVLVGNNDAHAKNTSLLYAGEGVRLAPVYDVLSTVVYPNVQRSLAMRIGGHGLWDDQLTTRRWWEQMQTLGLDAAATVREVALVPDRVLDAWDRTVREVHDEGAAFAQLDDVRRAVERRRAAIVALPIFVPRRRRPRPPRYAGADPADTASS